MVLFSEDTQPVSAPFAVVSEKKAAGDEAIFDTAVHGEMAPLSVEQSDADVEAP